MEHYIKAEKQMQFAMEIGKPFNRLFWQVERSEGT